MAKRVGRYEILAEIARGGAGTVYRAQDTVLGRDVALKLLHAGARATEVQRKRFEREAKACSRLQHPNLVAILDAGGQEGELFLVMPLVRGISLSDRLSRGGVYSEEKAAALIAALASGLAHAHEQGVLHRDVKPSNVLLDPAGRPLLTDFGLARSVDPSLSSQLSVAGELIGTVGYMPPEQARGDLALIGPRSDVYGLGATFFAVLTGEPPFTGTPVERLSAMLKDIRKPSELRPGLDSALEAICLRALANDPDGRYESAEAFGDALQEWLRRPRGQGRGRSKIAALLGVALLGVVLLGVAMSHFRAAWVTLTSDANGVTVLENGRELGALEIGRPLELELDPGQHVFTLRRGGAETTLPAVDLSRGQHQSLPLSLLYTVELSADVQGARGTIREGGRALEIASDRALPLTLQLPLGRYALEVRASKHHSYRSEFVASPSSGSPSPAHLPPIERWSHELARDIWVPATAVEPNGDGVRDVLVVARDKGAHGVLFALSGTDGHELWRYAQRVSVWFPPLRAGEELVVSSTDDSGRPALHWIDPSTGAREHSASLSGMPSARHPYGSAPVALDPRGGPGQGYALALQDPNRVRGVTRKGVEWELTPAHVGLGPSAASSVPGILTLPVDVNRDGQWDAILWQKDHTVYCVEALATRPQVRWTQPPPRQLRRGYWCRTTYYRRSPDDSGDVLLVWPLTGNRIELRRVNTRGDVVWQRVVPGTKAHEEYGAVTWFDVNGDGSGDVLVPTPDGLHLYHGATGELNQRWESAKDLSSLSRFRAPHGPFLAASRRTAPSRLFVFDRHGREVWRQDLSGPFCKLTVADLDGDGKDELLSVESAGTVRAWSPYLEQFR